MQSPGIGEFIENPINMARASSGAQLICLSQISAFAFNGETFPFNPMAVPSSLLVAESNRRDIKTFRPHSSGPLYLLSAPPHHPSAF